MPQVRARSKQRYSFTRHALERIKERGLSLEAVGRALMNGRRFPINKTGFRCVLGNLQVILAYNGAVVTAYQS